MAENWKPYLCNVNDKLASILVDLALRGEAPIASKPWLLWTWVYFQSPRTAGLSDSKEAPILYEIIKTLYTFIFRKLAKRCLAEESPRMDDVSFISTLSPMRVSLKQ